MLLKLIIITFFAVQMGATWALQRGLIWRIIKIFGQQTMQNQDLVIDGNAYHIRRATIDDVPAITDIYNQTVGVAHANFEPVSLDAKIWWFNEHGANRPIFVLSDQEGVILAWLSLSDYSPRPAYYPTSEVSLYVHEHHKGKGLGAALLEHACECAYRCDIKNLVALIFAHNKPSLALFEKYGFVPWGCLPKVCLSEGKLCDVLILGKTIHA